MAKILREETLAHLSDEGQLTLAFSSIEHTAKGLTNAIDIDELCAQTMQGHEVNPRRALIAKGLLEFIRCYQEAVATYGA